MRLDATAQRVLDVMPQCADANSSFSLYGLLYGCTFRFPISFRACLLAVSGDVMSLEHKFCRVNFSTKIRTPGGRVPRESDVRTFLSKLLFQLDARGFS